MVFYFTVARLFAVLLSYSDLMLENIEINLYETISFIIHEILIMKRIYEVLLVTEWKTLITYTGVFLEVILNFEFR